MSHFHGPSQVCTLVTGQIMKGVFSRVTFLMTISGSHPVMEHYLSRESRYILSAVIDQGSLFPSSGDWSPSFANLREEALPFALKLACTKVISIECNLTNTGSWRLSSSSFHDPFPRFRGRKGSDPGVKLLVRVQIGFVCTLPVEFPQSGVFSRSFAGRDNPLIPRLCSVGCLPSKGNIRVESSRFSSVEVTLKNRRSFLLSQCSRVLPSSSLDAGLALLFTGSYKIQEGLVLHMIHTCEKKPS